MSGTAIVLIVARALGVLGCWGLLRAIVGESGHGRSMLPVVALGWPVFMLFAAVIGAVCLLDHLFDRRIDEAFGKGDNHR